MACWDLRAGTGLQQANPGDTAPSWHLFEVLVEQGSVREGDESWYEDGIEGVGLGHPAGFPLPLTTCQCHLLQMILPLPA